jgi:hypothetical protein
VLKQAIVVGRTPDESGALWAEDLLESLEGGIWPVVVRQTWDFELSSIGWAAGCFDEFVFLPASTIVKDLSLFDIAFEEMAGQSVNLGGVQQGYRFRMFLGKFLASSVVQLGVPHITTKSEAVQQEILWGEAYAKQEETAGRLQSLGGPLDHTDKFIDRHGRNNMVVQNEFLIRFKGTWDSSMIRESG